MREAIGEHQGLRDAARNVGKPFQCVVLVRCHAIVPASEPPSTARECSLSERKVTAIRMGDSTVMNHT